MLLGGENAHYSITALLQVGVWVVMLFEATEFLRALKGYEMERKTKFSGVRKLDVVVGMGRV